MFSDIFWRFLILKTLVIGALSASCPYVHPQIRYCTSQFVFQANVYVPADFLGRFNITILKLFKGNLSKLNMIINRKTTIQPDFNIDFKHGNKFAIFGNASNGDIHLNRCTGMTKWKSLTTFQRGALNSKYKTGCNCRNYIGHYKRSRYCKWRGSYMKMIHRHCTWVKNNHLRQCQIDNARLIKNNG